jgi:hypothetical protein
MQWQLLQQLGVKSATHFRHPSVYATHVWGDDDCTEPAHASEYE